MDVALILGVTQHAAEEGEEPSICAPCTILTLADALLGAGVSGEDLLRGLVEVAAKIVCQGSPSEEVRARNVEKIVTDFPVLVQRIVDHTATEAENAPASSRTH